ncbi:MAG TPA: AI-2E family transporter [Candidatus Limnocylindria bacterium]|nr:AI-2E family transporter [Candidatus Limnocylindria bacterium]
MDSSPVTPAPATATLPLRRVEFPPTWHAVIFGVVLVGLAVLVILAQEALAPYIVGLVLVFLMNGVVDRLQRAGVPRWGGTLIALFALIIAVVLFIWVIFAALVEQVSALIASLPEIADAMGDWLTGLELAEGIERALAGWVQGLPEAVPAFLTGLFGVFVSGVASVVALVIAWAGLPFWIFYALSDSPALMVGLRQAVPGSFRHAIFAILAILGDVFGAWARGTAIIAGIVFVPFLIGFTLFGIWIDADIGDYALLFAVTLAVSELIPIIGPVLAIIPILVITAVIAGIPGVVAVGLLFIVVEQIDGAVVQPKVQSHALDLHPAIILPALVVGSALAGLMGAILALPLTAAARQSIAYLLRITDGAPEPQSMPTTGP